MPRILVTGGTRSGKSAHAEGLLADRPAVTYVATGPGPDPADPAWTERVRAHRDRRPASWATVETTDLPGLPGSTGAGAVLVDSLGTWLTAQLDELGAWEAADWQEEWRRRSDAGVHALTLLPDLVVVSEEVGLGGLPGHPAARLFADLLGDLNQRVAAVCDEVHLVVTGRVLRL